MKTTLFNAMLAITMMMCSCEKFTPEEESSKPIPRENNVTLDLSSKNQVSMQEGKFWIFQGRCKSGNHQSNVRRFRFWSHSSQFGSRNLRSCCHRSQWLRHNDFFS